MYRVDLIYTDESTFTINGIGQYMTIGVVKDALSGSLGDDEKDVSGIYIGIADASPSTEE